MIEGILPSNILVTAELKLTQVCILARLAKFKQVELFAILLMVQDATVTATKVHVTMLSLTGINIIVR